MAPALPRLPEAQPDRRAAPSSRHADDHDRFGGGRKTVYRHTTSILGQWVDLRYRIRFGLTDGAVAAWLDGAPIVDYAGPLGYPDDAPDVDFRFGLYRDRMATPMVIYFDDYRKERLTP